MTDNEIEPTTHSIPVVPREKGFLDSLNVDDEDSFEDEADAVPYEKKFSYLRAHPGMNGFPATVVPE